MDDRVLYRQVLAGDEAALEMLVERYHRPLFAFLFRLSDDRALADDLAQEVFIRLLKYKGNPPQSFRAWLFTIARNLAHDHFRSKHHRHEQATDFAVDGYMSEDKLTLSPEQGAILTDRRQEMAAALQALPAEQREAVILRFYHDMPLNEIADITGAPLGTVKSRLFHALRKLKEQFVQVKYHE